MAISGVASTAGSRTWGTSTAYDVTSEFTMSLWLKAKSNNGTLRSIFNRGAASVSGGREFNCNSGASTHSVQGAARIAGGTRSTPTLSGLSVNVWHNVVMRYLSGSVPLEILADGVSGGSTAGTGSMATGDGFTANVWNISQLFEIAECASWSVCLSDAEIADLAAGFSPMIVRPESLHFYDSCLSSAINEFVSVTSSDSGTVNYVDHPPIIYPSGVLSVAQGAGSPPVTTNRRFLNLLGVGA